MHTRIVLLVMLLAAGIASLAYGAPPESFTVNGLKVIFARNTATDIVAVNMYFRGGLVALDPRQAGIEGLTLGVATQASKNYPKDRLHAALERMDSRLGSLSNADYSAVTLQCVKQNLTESWNILTDVLVNPVFAPADLELARNRTLSAIRQSRDNPDQYLQQLATHAFYTHHPYEIDVQGTEESVKGFTADNLRAFLKDRLTTSQMLLVVVGNLTRAELEPMVKASFGTLPMGSYKGSVAPGVSHLEPSLKIVRRELPTNYITGLFPVPEIGTADGYAMRLALSRLQQRVFEEVRTKRSLSYAPSAFAGPNFANYGSIYVTAVSPDTTIKVMLAEIKRLQDELTPAKELRDLTNQFLTGYYMGMETNASQADLLARYELIGRGYEEAGKIMDRFRAVTPEAVQKVCKEFMHNLQYVMIGNPPTLQVGAFMY